MKHIIKTFLFALIVIAAGSMYSPSFAHADTIYLSGAAGTVYAVANLRSTSIEPGAPINVDTYIYACGCATDVDTVLLQGGANGSLVSIIYAAISAGNTVYGSAQIGTAQSTPGSYAASFTAGMNVVPPPPAGSAYLQVLCNGAFYCMTEFADVNGGTYYVDNYSYGTTEVPAGHLYQVMSTYSDDCMYGYSAYPSVGYKRALYSGDTLTVEISCY